MYGSVGHVCSEISLCVSSETYVHSKLCVTDYCFGVRGVGKSPPVDQHVAGRG